MLSFVCVLYFFFLYAYQELSSFVEATQARNYVSGFFLIYADNQIILHIVGVNK